MFWSSPLFRFAILPLSDLYLTSILHCLVLSCLVLSCLVFSCVILSYLISSYLIFSYLVLYYLILYYLILSYLILPCLVLSCLAVTNLYYLLRHPLLSSPLLTSPLLSSKFRNHFYICIILIIPIAFFLTFLTTIAQRFFPDFFPSCYTEKRLNLRRLYAEIERKNDDILLGIEEESSEWGLWSSPLSDSFAKLSEVSSGSLDGFMKLLSSLSASDSKTMKDKEKDKDKDL